MWPWRRRIEVVSLASAGDDATAALTMILRYHHRPATIAEVREAIYLRGNEVANGLDVVKAAAQFRLQGRGLTLENPKSLAMIPTPNIAHLTLLDPGPFPRPVDLSIDGYFAIVVSISARRVRWIDPYDGELDGDHAEFLTRATGVFLVFDETPALPRVVVTAR